MAKQTKLLVITDQKDLAGKYVLVRCPFNVPIVAGQVTNQFRVLRSIATINYLVRAGARVVLISHLSSNKKTEQTETLRPVYELLQTHLPSIQFCDEVATPKAMAMRDDLEDGHVLLLENLRQDPREKKNDADFARALADMADLYVNNDFTVAHREHASVVGIPQFLPSYAGINFAHEYEELAKARAPQSPSLFMLGGAKFDTKLPLVKKYIDIYDHVFIGGALVHNIFKAQGYEIGTSLVSDDTSLDLTPVLEANNLLLPVDVIVLGEHGMRTCVVDEVESHEAILDAGPATITLLQEYTAEAKFILWNGPLGNYEKGFETGTTTLAKLIAETGAYSVVGGGDTIAAIESLGCQEKFSFMSTAGGAMLTFLEQGMLPGIEVLQAQKS